MTPRTVDPPRSADLSSDRLADSHARSGAPGDGQPIPAGWTGPGVVVSVDPDDPGVVQVAVPDVAEALRAEAAVPGADGLRAGSRVLVTTGTRGGAWVTGILDAGARRVAAREGSFARVVESDEGERIQVRSASGELLFEYDPDRGMARLNLPEGGLEVAAPHGDLTFAAGGAVRLRGDTIDLAATSGVRLLVHDAASRVLSALRLGRSSTRLSTKRARIDAEQGELRVDRGRLRGDRMETRVDHLSTRARRIDVSAETVVERFGSLCRRITGLLQTRAGRVRTRVEGAWHARARRADLRTKETFKVDGERIHLG